jgi:uncharacterized DUF497 family protein
MRPSFEWDPAKDKESRHKHGVSFSEAQVAFLDPSRVIARDVRIAALSSAITALDGLVTAFSR